jgi:hypothetical protein
MGKKEEVEETAEDDFGVKEGEELCEKANEEEDRKWGGEGDVDGDEEDDEVEDKKVDEGEE